MVRHVVKAQKPGSSQNMQQWKEGAFHKGPKGLLFKGPGHLQRAFVKLSDGFSASED